MRYIRHFDYFDSILAVRDDLTGATAVRRDQLPPGTELTEGFFVDIPELVYVIATAHGPALVTPESRMLLTRGSAMKLEGSGAARRLSIQPAFGRPTEIAAPEPDTTDVNDPDDLELVDFFLFLHNRIPMPHMQQRYRLP